MWFGGGSKKGSDDDRDDEAISQDRLNHPQCSYSRHLNRQCSYSSKQGMVCEQIRQVFRLCPGEPPRAILSVSSKEDGHQAEATTPAPPHDDDLLRKFSDDIARLIPPFSPQPNAKHNAGGSKGGGKQKPWSIKDFDKDEGVDA